MALPQISYPAYILTSSTDAGSAQLTLSIGREAELIGVEGADALAALLVSELGAMTGASVYTTKVVVTETAI